jgi:hypothetical protein
VETNDFNHVSHINLCFRHGTDAAVKQFLAFRLSETTEQFRAVQAQLDATILKLSSTWKEMEIAKDRAAAAELARQEALSGIEVALNKSEYSCRQGRIVQREELLRAFEMCEP